MAEKSKAQGGFLHWGTFFLNSTLHIIILLAIISSFFFFYVSKLSSNTFKNEITNLINEDFITAVKNADTKGLFKSGLQKTNLQPWISYYKNTPQDSTTIENEWLERTTIIILTFLCVMFLSTVVLLKWSCSQDIPMFRIVRDNIILFFFVGLIEIMFFYFIARRYIPVQPSVLITSIINTLKKEFA